MSSLFILQLSLVSNFHVVYNKASTQARQRAARITNLCGVIRILVPSSSVAVPFYFYTLNFDLAVKWTYPLYIEVNMWRLVKRDNW